MISRVFSGNGSVVPEACAKKRRSGSQASSLTRLPDNSSTSYSTSASTSSALTTMIDNSAKLEKAGFLVSLSLTYKVCSPTFTLTSSASWIVPIPDTRSQEAMVNAEDPETSITSQVCSKPLQQSGAAL